jgi:CheY-like chemotaxis protein
VRGDRLFDEMRPRGGVLPRVAVMTADMRDEAVTAFLARTRLPALAKPFTIEQLQTFVRSVLAAPGPAAH